MSSASARRRALSDLSNITLRDGHKPKSIGEMILVEAARSIDSAPVDDLLTGVVPTVIPDADRVVDQSAGASTPGKRKELSGIKKKKKKRKGGYTDKGRLAFKAEGGALATGQAHTCIPDALFVLLPSLLLLAPDLDTVRAAIMGTALHIDALFTTAQTYVASLGLRLEGVHSKLTFERKGGPAFQLLQAKGLFLVHLAVSYGPEDKEPDDHCVAYDGLTIRDNNMYMKVKELDDRDRSSPELARKVFDSLYPTLMVRIKNVLELS